MCGATDGGDDKLTSIRACLLDSFTSDSEGLAVDQQIFRSLDPLFHVLLHAGREAWQDAQTDNIDKQRGRGDRR